MHILSYKTPKNKAYQFAVECRDELGWRGQTDKKPVLTSVVLWVCLQLHEHVAFHPVVHYLCCVTFLSPVQQFFRRAVDQIEVHLFTCRMWRRGWRYISSPNVAWTRSKVFHKVYLRAATEWCSKVIRVKKNVPLPMSSNLKKIQTYGR